MFPLTREWYRVGVRVGEVLGSWPLVKQLREGDPLGLGRSAQSAKSAALRPRIAEADSVAQSICPFCAVGCAQLAYVKDGRVIQVEGDPASPISGSPELLFHIGFGPKRK